MRPRITSYCTRALWAGACVTSLLSLDLASAQSANRLSVPGEKADTIEVRAGDETLTFPVRPTKDGKSTKDGDGITDIFGGNQPAEGSLELRVVDRPEIIRAGERLRVELELENTGQASVEDVEVDLTFHLGDSPLPERFRARAATPLPGRCLREGQRQWCPFDEIEAGGRRRIRVEVAVPSAEANGALRIEAQVPQAAGTGDRPTASLVVGIVADMAIQVVARSSGVTEAVEPTGGLGPFQHDVRISRAGGESSEVAFFVETLVRAHPVASAGGAGTAGQPDRITYQFHDADCKRPKAADAPPEFEGRLVYSCSAEVPPSQGDSAGATIAILGRVQGTIPPSERWEVTTRAWLESREDEASWVATRLYSKVPVEIFAVRPLADGVSFRRTREITSGEVFRVVALWGDSAAMHAVDESWVDLEEAQGRQSRPLAREIPCTSVQGFEVRSGLPSCHVSLPIRLQTPGPVRLRFRSADVAGLPDPALATVGEVEVRAP